MKKYKAEAGKVALQKSREELKEKPRRGIIASCQGELMAKFGAEWSESQMTRSYSSAARLPKSSKNGRDCCRKWTAKDTLEIQVSCESGCNIRGKVRPQDDGGALNDREFTKI